jgi:hypothetical protein
MDSLIAAVKEEHARSIQERAKVLEYLNDPVDSGLLIRKFDSKIRVTPTLINRLFEDGKAGKDTLRHLKALERCGRSFSDTDQLLSALHILEMQSIMHKREIRTTLSEGGECEAVGGANALVTLICIIFYVAS